MRSIARALWPAPFATTDEIPERLARVPAVIPAPPVIQTGGFSFCTCQFISQKQARELNPRGTSFVIDWLASFSNAPGVALLLEPL